MSHTAVEAATTAQPAETRDEKTTSTSIYQSNSGPSAAGNDVSEPSSASVISGPAISTEVSHSISPSKKRALPEPSAEEQPSSKRSKESPPATPDQNGTITRATFPSPPDYPATKHDKETWQGFCDIESDPALFSVILRDMGVSGITVREIFALTPEYLKSMPQPIYGLILLFRYREFGNADQATDCPSDIWFANQLPAQNSCGTLAMINVLTNSTEVGIGEHLDQFKEFTKPLTPFQRGEAFASFDFVKKIHNSFAKKMDFLENDRYLSMKVNRAQREKREKMEEANAAKKKGKTTISSSQTGNRRSTRRHSADSAATNDSAEGYEDSAHHFIAFVPVGNEVWKLDGYDSQPTSMGTFSTEKGETWLSSASDTIAALMAAGDDDYGVIALTQSPLMSLRKKACLTINTVNHIEARLDTLDANWKSFIDVDDQPPSPRMLGLSEHLLSHSVSESTKSKIDTELVPDLIDRRSRLTQELGQLAAGIMMEIQSEADEDEKAAQRRYDCGPVIKKWLEMLAENGYLEENLERFMPVAVGKKGAIK